MAVTAAMSLSSSTAKTGQTVTATCTLTNGGTSDVRLTSLTPGVVTDGDSGLVQGQAPLGGSFPATISASGGTLKVSWTAVALSPLSSYGLSQPASQAYAITAAFSASDGSAGLATSSTLTVGYAAN